MTEHAPFKIRLPDAPPEYAGRLADGRAIAWCEPINIRTYPPADPVELPMYFEHRVYQGSSGKVYPIPFTEQINADAVDRDWDAIHIENTWLRLVILPQLGGRVHIGYDKSTGYDFIYRNNVIKPALVGLAGPWISGGIEFNWPQHHRPATFLPVETEIEHAPDGSVTVWCSDHDPFTRMKGMHGIRLHPDRSVVELVVRLHNRTSLRQSFLWWTNVAVHVHDEYQSFFPEDVGYVADHARRGITRFPAADRRYYGIDYPAMGREQPGADRLDFYRNIPVPTSYMIVDSEQSFFGGYDHAAQSGFVHFADRGISPGKKQWTWGNAPFGHSWDRHLTDADGPYIELMAGVYTDNQPDFSWLLPGETRSFTQTIYPIPGIGVVHQATPAAAVHIDRDKSHLARFAVTGRLLGRARLGDHSGIRAESAVDLAPGEIGELSAELDESTAWFELTASDGTVMVRWEPTQSGIDEPAVAEEPPPPDQVASVEELCLIGTHLIQYRHPTRSPMPYWQEALRRDPGHSGTHLALAERAMRSASYEAARRHSDAALGRLTRRNPNPQCADAYYLRALSLSRLGRTEEAIRDFRKASWDGALSASANFEAARLLSATGRNGEALALLDSASATGQGPRARALRVVLFMRSNDHPAAQSEATAALDRDPLDPVIRTLVGKQVQDAGILVDVALDLASFGELERAVHLLLQLADAPIGPASNVGPLALYHAAALLDRLNRHGEAAVVRRRARDADRRWTFPAGLDAHDSLQAAIHADADDAVARLLLGELLYGIGRRNDAADLWDEAIALGLDDPVLYRNAGLAAYCARHDDTAAMRLYARARQLDPTSPRLLFEQDQLAKRLGEADSMRLTRLEREVELTGQRDDLTIEMADVLISLGRAVEALRLIEGRSFRPWEGGEGRVLALWDRARDALSLPNAEPPNSLGEQRAVVPAPATHRDNGEPDYFATSLPDLLLFTRETDENF